LKARSAARALPCLLALSALPAACGTQKREVELVFYDDGKGPHGFTCHLDSDPDTLLLERVATDKRLSLVVDFIQLDGSPICSGVALLEWCSAHPCPLLVARRACFDVPLDFLADAGAGTPKIQLLRAALDELKGQLVTGSAPEAIVLVRVVATTASCDDVEKRGAAFQCDKLVGCVVSCPVYLPDAGSTVQLDLDVTPEQCNETAIHLCAAPELANHKMTCSE
jgi:hypothetical protein